MEQGQQLADSKWGQAKILGWWHEKVALSRKQE